MMGIRAWNRPNHKPQTKAMRQENLFVVKPLQMETEKASIDRPMAMSRSSMKLMSFAILATKIGLFFNGNQEKPYFCRVLIN